MKIAATIARYLLGLAFTVFGLNGFLHFLKQPPLPAGSPAAAFTGAMAGTGYIAVVFAVQLVCGVLLLSGFYVPLALVMIAPVIVNILLFHITMAPEGLPPGVITAVLWGIVAIRCRKAFAGLFRRRMPS
jgi:putative oxidoreductase